MNVPEGYEQPDREEIARMVEVHANKTKIVNSERTLAIISGVDLEELLGNILSNIFIDDKQAENTLQQVFNTFYSKIEVAYSLGLISSDEYVDLNITRKIRNYFAHTPEGSSFNDQKVIDLCINLRIPQQRPELFDDLSTSEKFDSVVFVLRENLWQRAEAAKQKKASIPEEIDSSHWQEYF